MGVITMFYGIIISMYFFDNRQHKRPHIHAKYQDHEAVFAIPEGEMLDGGMPSIRQNWCSHGLKSTRRN